MLYCSISRSIAVAVADSFGFKTDAVNVFQPAWNTGAAKYYARYGLLNIHVDARIVYLVKAVLGSILEYKFYLAHIM